MDQSFALFETAIGKCGIAWNDTHILAIRLPGRDDAATAATMRKHGAAMRGAAPPPFVEEAIAAITAHLGGTSGDLSGLDAIPLDFSRLSAFDRGVLEACRAIRSGTTRTYGDIARDLGDPLAARAVGAALGRNPWPIVVPCHRVVAANGKLGGFSAPGGRDAKLRLLAIEGARMPGDAADLFQRETAATAAPV